MVVAWNKVVMVEVIQLVKLLSLYNLLTDFVCERRKGVRILLATFPLHYITTLTLEK